MLKEKMNNIVINELIENDVNGFLNDINSILEEKEKENNKINIKNEFGEGGCLYPYFSISYDKFSDVLKPYNICWVSNLKRFCYCTLTVPTVAETIKTEKVETETKETKDNLLVKGKNYNDIKQHSLRFDTNLKNELDNLYKEYSYLDRTYINSRIIELGLNSI